MREAPPIGKVSSQAAEGSRPYAGRVSSGLTDAELRYTYPAAHELVRVSADPITRAFYLDRGVYRRQVVYERLRGDKPAKDARRPERANSYRPTGPSVDLFTYRMSALR
jgi:hypothetical protein